MICTLAHYALPFSGHSGFASTALDNVTQALSSDAVPVLLATGPQIAELRDELGAAGASVVGYDMTVDGRNPARIIPALQRLIDDHPHRALGCIAEPIPPRASPAYITEVELHELLLRLPPFADWNVQLCCAYDADALPSEVIARIEAQHADTTADSADQVDRLRSQPLAARPDRSEELGVDRTTLGALRGFIEARAQAAGLGKERVDDLVYAVNEVVTNSLCHGEGRARVSFWMAPDSAVCEVRDRGWIRDPLAGRMAPHPDRVNGRGLWLVNQLCDFVQLRSSPSGTTVRMQVDV